jgi:hypothetical protein
MLQINRVFTASRSRTRLRRSCNTKTQVQTANLGHPSPGLGSFCNGGKLLQKDLPLKPECDVHGPSQALVLVRR